MKKPLDAKNLNKQMSERMKTLLVFVGDPWQYEKSHNVFDRAVSSSSLFLRLPLNFSQFYIRIIPDKYHGLEEKQSWELTDSKPHLEMDTKVTVGQSLNYSKFLPKVN